MSLDKPLLLVLFAFVAIQAVPPAESMLDTVRRLSAADTNEARRAVLEDALRARRIPFAAETFTLEQPRGAEPRTEGRNLVATFGSGSRQIVVGAHYDAARLPDRSLSRGAVDNAASSVVLIHLADALRKESLPGRITLVWFDMEELGLIGSARFVETHKSDPPAAMINLDINAYGDVVLFGPRSAQNAAPRRAVLETCGELGQICVEYPQMPPGDDQSFTRAQIPTVSLAFLPAVEAHQLWLLLHGGKESGLDKQTMPSVLRTIHTAGDTIDKVDEAAMKRVYDFTLALVRRVAEVARR